MQRMDKSSDLLGELGRILLLGRPGQGPGQGLFARGTMVREGSREDRTRLPQRGPRDPGAWMPTAAGLRAVTRASQHPPIRGGDTVDSNHEG